MTPHVSTAVFSPPCHCIFAGCHRDRLKLLRPPIWLWSHLCEVYDLALVMDVFIDHGRVHYDIQHGNLLFVASNTVLIYDCVITFGREVELFWRSRRSIACILFFATRNSLLLLAIIDLLTLAQLSEKARYPYLYCLRSHYGRATDMTQSCDTVIRGVSVVSDLRYLPIAIFSGMRAYALCQSYVLSLLITFLSLVPLGVNFAQYGIGIEGALNTPFWAHCLVSQVDTPKMNILYFLHSHVEH
ncbi:hypothetical protein C8Q74DRAFT_910041 [Fomes fomentarius]|nr:hypothetical protein C8Q74DRAFT_910041 [Fomes fomentarius]